MDGLNLKERKFFTNKKQISDLAENKINKKRKSTRMLKKEKKTITPKLTPQNLTELLFRCRPFNEHLFALKEF